MHIEPGFIIEVTSWENDGDNYSTRRLSGQSKHVAYVADQLLPLFNSKSAGGLGNFYPYRRKTPSFKAGISGDTCRVKLEKAELI